MIKSRKIKTLTLIVSILILSTVHAQSVNNNSLSLRQQGLVALSATAAIGDLPQLKQQLNTALDAGVTINEIKEALTQLYAYCGFPRSLNALNTFKAVLDERKAKGISDAEGKKIVVENNAKDKYEQGRKVLEDLTKTPQARPAPGFGEFAPRIDVFLKEHLFADVFAADVLSYQQRELVTISALAAMDGVETQLKSHLAIGKNTGLTDAQLAAVSGIIEKVVNRTQANKMRGLLSLATKPLIEKDMLVRISEIEVVPEYLDEYLSFAKEVGATSVREEPGVICIYPMQQKRNKNVFRILEIYTNQEAYQSHIKSAHFQKYKTGTLHMVKSLDLVDMNALDSEEMNLIFEKMKQLCKRQT